MGQEGGKYNQHCTSGKLRVVWTLQHCYVTQTTLESTNTVSQSSGIGKPQNRCSSSFCPHLCARSGPTPSAHAFCSCVYIQNSQRLDKSQTFTAIAPSFKRERDTAMRQLVKRKQKVAARNSKFLPVELNFLKDAQHSISVCHLLKSWELAKGSGHNNLTTG